MLKQSENFPIKAHLDYLNHSEAEPDGDGEGDDDEEDGEEGDNPGHAVVTIVTGVSDLTLF